MSTQPTTTQRLFQPPENHPVGQLFDSKAPLFVDPYQRDYAWTFRSKPQDEPDEGEVADFIYDLGRVIDETSKKPDALPYFFGLVVTAEESNTGWIPSVSHEIVDGQQRLTTFALLASAMIEAADSIRREAEDDGASDVAKRCTNLHRFLWERCVERELKGTQSQDPKLFNILELTEGDNAYYQKLVRGDNPGHATRDSCVLLGKAKDGLRSAVEEWLPADGSLAEREKSLTTIRNAVFERTEVILITAHSTVDAYRLFAVANNRGKRLEQADLLRAYLLRLVSGSSLHALRTEVASAWTEIDRRKPDRVNAALRAYYGSVQGVRAPKVDVFDAFARDIFSQSEYATLNDSEARTVKKQVVAIRDAVILFDEKLLAGEWPYPKTKTGASDWERHLLERVVVRLKSQRALPLLLAAASIWKDEQSFTRLMRLVERAEVRFLIANAHQSTVADRYFEAAKQVRSGADVVAIESLLEPWVAALADDVSFRAGLNGLNYKRRSVRIRHLLAMLEDYRPSYLRSKRRGNAEKPKANELRNWNLSAVDIDHVYPQHPPSGGTPKLDELKHQLGNLTLLLDSDNRELAKNLLPWDPAKIAIYKESHVRLTEALGKQIEKTGWDADRLADHQKELVAMAEFVYQVSPAAKTAAKSIS